MNLRQSIPALAAALAFPLAPAVAPFAQAADDSPAASAESIAPADSLPASDAMSAGPVLAATTIATAEQPSIVGRPNPSRPERLRRIRARGAQWAME